MLQLSLLLHFFCTRTFGPNILWSGQNGRWCVGFSVRPGTFGLGLVRMNSSQYVFCFVQLSGFHSLCSNWLVETYRDLVTVSRKHQYRPPCSQAPSQTCCHSLHIQRRRTGHRLPWTRHSTSWDALTSYTSYHRHQPPVDNALSQCLNLQTLATTLPSTTDQLPHQTNKQTGVATCQFSVFCYLVIN